MDLGWRELWAERMEVMFVIVIVIGKPTVMASLMAVVIGKEEVGAVSVEVVCCFVTLRGGLAWLASS